MSNLTKKTFALAAAAAFATATPLAVAPDLAPVAIAQQANNAIDASKPVSLTISKQDNTPGQDQKAISGTEFKVERIKMTNGLNTAKGWEEANEIVEGGATAATVDETIGTKATGSDGTVKFDNLKVGLYRVTEMTNGDYTVAAPFLVTLPLTEEDGTINYNPTIEPKNQLINPTKAVSDTNKNVGDTVTYTVKAPVPAGDVLQDGSRTISDYRIEDQVPAAFTLNDGSAEVTLLNSTETLAEGDYTVTYENNRLVVKFTDAGRTKLANLRKDNPELQVQVVFGATVKTIPANGTVVNTAEVYVPNRDGSIKSVPERDIIDGNKSNSDENKEKNDTKTQYVNVVFSKTVNDKNKDNEKTGAGAEFQVVPCENGKVSNDAEALNAANEAGDAKTGNTFTTVGGDDSTPASVTAFALQFDPETEYCAVETKAPEGFLLNPEPQKLVKGEDVNGRPVYTVTTNDVKDNIWGRLPATGERTMLYILALGLVLFGGGAAYQLSRRNA